MLYGRRFSLRAQATSALCGLALFCFLGTSCAPIRNTAVVPMSSAVRTSYAPTVDKLMVAGLQADGVQVGMVGPASAVLSRFHDPHISAFTSAIQGSGIAKRVAQSPVSNVTNREVLLAAKSYGATHLVSSRILSFKTQGGSNGRLAWSFILGFILLPFMAVFLLLVKSTTLHVTATLEFAIWDVAAKRRVWTRQLTGEAWGTASIVSYRKRIPHIMSTALNEAYRRGLPTLLNAMRVWIKPPTTPARPTNQPVRPMNQPAQPTNQPAQPTNQPVQPPPDYIPPPR